MDFITQPKRKSSSKKVVWIIVISCSIIVTLILFTVFGSGNKDTLAVNQPKEQIVPSDIGQKVSFFIYYPDTAKLPAGYTLDRKSFSTNGEVVVYALNYRNDKKIAFTLQKKPSEDQLKIFYKNQIPLRTEIKTPLGTAAISAINNQRFLSLPIEPDVWLIATAPIDIDPTVLEDIAKQIIRSE